MLLERSNSKRSLAIVALTFNRRASFEQRTDYIEMTLLCGKKQRYTAIIVTLSNMCAGFNQRLNNL